VHSSYDAERAAAKVRHAAEIPKEATLSEREKSRAETDVAEAHAELEQSKYHRGKPPGGRG